MADLRGFERVGHLAPVTMPGGVAAIREPWRMAVAWAAAAGIDPAWRPPSTTAAARRWRPAGRAGQGPVTTSMGRLFDALAALLGLRATVTYEAQAAVALEAAARSGGPVGGARLPGRRRPRRRAPGARPPPADRRRGRRPPGRHAGGVVAAGVHEAIGRAGADMAARLARRHGLHCAALSGGVFQNVRLSEIVEEGLRAAGLEVLVHRQIPANDGGISIGQAAVAAARHR